MSRDRRVVLTADAAALRSRLGPTAWVVFEELLLASAGSGERCVATVSIRTLAGRLGLAKDTVARAVGRLRRVGLVAGRQTRSGSGVFEAGSYGLTVPDSIVLTNAAPTSPATTRSPERPSQQLVLTFTS